MNYSKEPTKRYKRPEEVVLPPIPTQLFDRFELLFSQFNVKQQAPLDILERLYSYMDEYNKFVATFTVCEKGCSACCNIPVNISRLEAEYISKKAGKSVTNKIIQKSGSCPFLSETGTCSIYRQRPFNCRTFHTADDPKYCSTNEDHVVYGVSSLGYGSAILSQIAELIRILNVYYNGEYKDIRSFFG